MQSMQICGAWNAASKIRRQPLEVILAGILMAGILSMAATARGTDNCTTVRRVYDGDTVLVSTPEGRYLVRLLGIDAPETSKPKGRPGQPFSDRSRRHLNQRVLARCVRLEVYGNDKYGRRLAVIHLGETNINLEMVSQGLAEVYRGRTPDGFDRRPYRQAEAQARRNGRGMWVQGEAYRSPIDWKHGR
jgi:endonuclease YncB( thermonuclease family)